MALLLFIVLTFQFIFANALQTDQSNMVDTEKCPVKEKPTLREIALRVENDSFAKTDRNYTHGTAISALSHDLKNLAQIECLPWPLRIHLKLFDFLTPDFLLSKKTPITSNSFVAKFGQAIYTPRDPSKRDVVLNDRPYAGLLYAGLSLQQRHYNAQLSLEVLDIREITLGVIGPLSFAKEFQDFVHRIDGDGRFLGWENQLNNEPALQLNMEKKFKTYYVKEEIIPGFSVDLIPSYGLRLGNIETSANLTLESRLGWNLPNDFGSFVVRPGTDSHPPDVAPRPEAASPRFGFNFFTILELRYVGYNFSVDGNLLSSSHRVTRQPWITTGAAGISFPGVIKNHAFHFAVMQVYQSSDFREQDAHHAYRSVGLSVEF